MVTVILAAIWFAAVAVVIKSREDIPAHLLGIGTLFFLLLVPSMKELIRNVDSFVGRGRQDDRAPGND